MASKRKNPSAFKRTGFWPIALAAFLKRPQADESNRRYQLIPFYAWRLALAIPVLKTLAVGRRQA
jgi:hypothetical protein